MGALGWVTAMGGRVRISGDWRDTLWGQMLVVAVVLGVASIALLTEKGVGAAIHVVALLVLLGSGALFVYALLRVLKVLPVIKGRRRTNDR